MSTIAKIFIAMAIILVISLFVEVPWYVALIVGAAVSFL